MTTPDVHKKLIEAQNLIVEVLATSPGEWPALDRERVRAATCMWLAEDFKQSTSHEFSATEVVEWLQERGREFADGEHSTLYLFGV